MLAWCKAAPPSHADFDRGFDALARAGHSVAMPPVETFRTGCFALFTDQFRLFWEIVPEALARLFGDHDTTTVARAAMMWMRTFGIAALEAAFHAS